MRPGILLVDDDAAIREALRMALEDEGYHVLEAAEGATALAVLREQNRPLVALLDHIMPGMDGAETLRHIARDTDLARRHAYVLLTAVAPEALALLLRSIDGLRVQALSKPFDLDELFATVERAAEACGNLQRAAL